MYVFWVTKFAERITYGPVFYLPSSLLKRNKLWNPNPSFNLSKSIFYLNVLRIYLSKEIKFLKSAPYLTWDCLRWLWWTLQRTNQQKWFPYENQSHLLSFTSFLHLLFLFWGHCDVTPQVHISCDVTGPLLNHTKFTQCILKQNKENTNVYS